MKINDFIKAYNQADNKQEYINSVIKRTYVPIIEKADMAERLVRSANIIDGEYSRHSFLSSLLHELAIVALYTNIDIDFSGRFDQQFDQLAELGIIKMIRATLPHDEVMAFDDIYWDTESDLEYNETEPHKFFKLQIDRVANVITSLGQPVIDEIIKSGKIEELLKE